MKSFKDRELIWTIFNLKRAKKGNYYSITNLDEAYFIRQNEKLMKSNRLVIFIFADLFAELVYENKFTQFKKDLFKRNFEAELSKVVNFSDSYFESDLVDEFWDRTEFENKFRKLKNDFIPKVDLKKQIELRKTLYNPNGYKISNSEATKKAKSALAVFKLEEILVNKLINK